MPKYTLHNKLTDIQKQVNGMREHQ